MKLNLIEKMKVYKETNDYLFSRGLVKSEFDSKEWFTTWGMMAVLSSVKDCANDEALEVTTLDGIVYFKAEVHTITITDDDAKQINAVLGYEAEYALVPSQYGILYIAHGEPDMDATEWATAKGVAYDTRVSCYSRYCTNGDSFLMVTNHPVSSHVAGGVLTLSTIHAL